MSFTLKIKTSNEATFQFEGLNSQTLVKDLKELISKHYNGETGVADQRLIFAGKVLKDEEPLSTYKLADGNTVHLVRAGIKKAAPPPSSSDATTTAPSTMNTTLNTTTPGAAPINPLANMFGAGGAMPPLGAFTGGPGLGGGMGGGMGGGLPPGALNDPMFATMMSQMMSNPQMLDTLIASNPQLAQMITPEMRAQLASPQFQAMVSNPQMMQQMLQMQSMMGGGGMGGGMGAAGNPFANTGGNPLASLGGMGGMGAGMNPLANMYGQPIPQTPSQPPEELYATQLQQLRDMGFFSQPENIRALQISRGNVEAAVEILFSRPPGTL